MAKVYRAPEDAPPFADPAYNDENGRFSFEKYEAAATAYIERMQQWARDNGNGKHAGEMYYVGVADGKAAYVVFKTRPLSLIWLQVWDSYRASAAEERGTRLEDIEAHLNFEKMWKELGEKQAAERAAQEVKP